MRPPSPPLDTLLVHRATGRLCSILLKVLWAVISKTIPWLAALIENNEGHIEHMVAVVSPFPPSFLLFSLALIHTCVCVSRSPKLPQTKGSVKLCHSQAKNISGNWKGGRTFSKLFFFSSSDKSMSTQSVGSEPVTSESVGGKMLHPLRRAEVEKLADALCWYQAPLFYMWIQKSALHYQGPFCHWKLKNNRASIF